MQKLEINFDVCAKFKLNRLKTVALTGPLPKWWYEPCKFTQNTLLSVHKNKHTHKKINIQDTTDCFAYST